jgi:hypothetical protein
MAPNVATALLAWWQLTGLAQLAEFHSGLSQPARDQLRAIDREAAQAVSSNRESSGTAQFADSIAATLADPIRLELAQAEPQRSLGTG